jgi:hypothetical protein
MVSFSRQKTICSIRKAVFLTVLWSLAFAGEQGSDADRESVEKLLDLIDELGISSWQECPYPALRVRPPSLSEGETAGWVLIIFDVSEAGRAINAQIVESRLGSDRQHEAVELIKLFSFRP